MAKRLKAEEDGVSPREFLSDAQVNKLLLYITKKANLAKRKGTTRASVDELIILLLVSTGVRASELCNLNIADLPSNHNENTIWIRKVQGSVNRSIEVASELTKYIAMFVKLYREGAKQNEPLLISERGKRFIYMSLYSKVKRIGEKAGIGKLCPNMLRRTYLIRLYNNKQDLRFVQKQIGHASRKTTAMYVRTSIEHEQKVETMDTADSSAVKSAEDFDVQAMARCFKLQKAIDHRGSNYPKGSQQTVTCEACGKSISVEAGIMIDSGQVLCPDCLNELHKSGRH